MVAQAGWRLRRLFPVHPLCSVEKLVFSWSNISCCHLILSPVHPQWAHINISLKTGRGREATSEALKFIFWHFNSVSGCFVFWPGVFFPMEMRGVSGWKRERLFFQQDLLKQTSCSYSWPLGLFVFVSYCHFLAWGSILLIQTYSLRLLSRGKWSASCFPAQDKSREDKRLSGSSLGTQYGMPEKLVLKRQGWGFMNPKLTVSALILFQALGNDKSEQKDSCISCFDDVRNVWWQFWCYFWSQMNRRVWVVQNKTLFLDEPTVPMADVRRFLVLYQH